MFTKLCRAVSTVKKRPSVSSQLTKFFTCGGTRRTDSSCQSIDYRFIDPSYFPIADDPSSIQLEAMNLKIISATQLATRLPGVFFNALLDCFSYVHLCLPWTLFVLFLTVSSFNLPFAYSFSIKMQPVLLS